MRLALASSSALLTMTPSVGQHRPSRSTLTCLLLIAWSITGASAFVSSSCHRCWQAQQQKQCRSSPLIPILLAQNSDDHGDGDGEPESIGGMPQLPPCQDQRTRSDSQSDTQSDTLFSQSGGNTVQLGPFVASRKFQLQYTCNVCETRNTNSVSRVAYRSGVVIARCKGCESQHVIADNLGWTDYKGGFQKGETNIEEYFANRGMGENVSRVSPDVFHLEKTLFHDSKSGSIIGDDGNPALE